MTLESSYIHLDVPAASACWYLRTRHSEQNNKEGRAKGLRMMQASCKPPARRSCDSPPPAPRRAPTQCGHQAGACTTPTEERTSPSCWPAIRPQIGNISCAETHSRQALRRLSAPEVTQIKAPFLQQKLVASRPILFQTRRQFLLLALAKSLATALVTDSMLATKNFHVVDCCDAKPPNQSSTIDAHFAKLHETRHHCRANATTTSAACAWLRQSCLRASRQRSRHPAQPKSWRQPASSRRCETAVQAWTAWRPPGSQACRESHGSSRARTRAWRQCVPPAASCLSPGHATFAS